MQYIQKPSFTQIEVKKSKFISYLCAFHEFDTLMKRLREEHPKARHWVYAYRYLNEFDQVVENSSDDGEPKGTSGKPTLAVLKGKELVNSAVITVRYFGGIKLGTGGLVKAYSDACNAALEEAFLSPYEKLFTYKFFCTYADLAFVEHRLSEIDVNIAKKEFLAEGIEAEVLCTKALGEQMFTRLDRVIKPLSS